MPTNANVGSSIDPSTIAFKEPERSAVQGRQAISKESMNRLVPLPILEKWDCHTCGVCCKGHTILLDADDLARLTSQGWETRPEFAGDAHRQKALLARFAASAQPTTRRLLHLSDGRQPLPYPRRVRRARQTVGVPDVSLSGFARRRRDPRHDAANMPFIGRRQGTTASSNNFPSSRNWPRRRSATESSLHLPSTMLTCEAGRKRVDSRMPWNAFFSANRDR